MLLNIISWCSMPILAYEYVNIIYFCYYMVMLKFPKLILTISFLSLRSQYSLEMNFTHKIFTLPNPVSNVTLYTSASSYIYFFSYTINVIFGLPIHSYVLWLICSGTRSGIEAEFFNLNLTVCEIIFCLTNLVLIFGIKLQEIIYFAYFSVTLPSVGRPLINCMICIERYLAVLHPVSFLKFKPLRYRLPCSAVIWVMVLGFGCLFLLFTINMSTFISIYLSVFSVLLSIKLFCCLVTVRALKHPGPGTKGKDRKDANHIKKKAIVVILIIILSMLVQYSPLIFTGLLYSTLAEADLSLSISVLNFLIFGYVSPILYIYRFRKV